MTNVAALPALTPHVVDTRYTQDVIPVLDTGKFEHMQRIAMIMAKGSTIPNSLKFVDGDPKTPFPDEVVIANCFRVVNQAVRWGMDPFAVMDCASIIHGKLMWEGKLVAAVLDAKLGIKLNYRYDEKPGQDLGVTVYATLPGETEPREIFGRVKDWHKGTKSPWANEGAWKRQLRYMGNREWARAHAPAIMLGVYTDDELDDIASRDVPAGQRALRFKDVTPAKPATLEIPDVPDAEPPAQITQEVEGISTPEAEKFVSNLADEIALCTSAQELDEITVSNADMIERLPEDHQKRARKLLKDAAE